MKCIYALFAFFALPIFLLGQPSFQKIGTSGGNNSGRNSALTTSSVELYNQLGNDGNSLLSQNMNAGADQYDSESADDFTVPDGKVWIVNEVVISFFVLSIPTPTVSLTVRFYNDNSGKPGTLHTEFANINVNTTDFFNSGVIELPNVVNLMEGTYWISVVANYGTSPSFYWDMQYADYGNTAHFRNPSGLFGVGTDWNPITSIGISGPYNNLSFALYGVSSTVPFPIFGSILAFLGIGAASFFGLRKKRKKLL